LPRAATQLTLVSAVAGSAVVRAIIRFSSD
jgi:hypothetical protein